MFNKHDPTKLVIFPIVQPGGLFTGLAPKSMAELSRLGYAGSVKRRPSSRFRDGRRSPMTSTNPGHCLSNHRRCRSDAHIDMRLIVGRLDTIRDETKNLNILFLTVLCL